MLHRRSLLLALAATPAFAQGGAWTPLFNGRDMEGFTPVGNANWRVEDGALVADRGTGFLMTTRSFSDFDLRTEVFLDPRTNSGIFIRISDPARIGSATSYEINLWDERPEQRYGTGAIVDVAAVDPMPRAGGRWNTLEISARGEVMSVTLNGQRTVDGARHARFRDGPLALQHAAGVNNDDSGVIRFRRLEIRLP
ncbi:DUF1080 domain-containing protein [Roseococcus sp. DSY-14]|uniref:3-keto-disaccharide hydrolase n=1 Tax=Roseococcus sp. DSY-14 TaxID=3369650 RepID=UPI00387B841A